MLVTKQLIVASILFHMEVNGAINLVYLAFSKYLLLCSTEEINS